MKTEYKLWGNGKRIGGTEGQKYASKRLMQTESTFQCSVMLLHKHLKCRHSTAVMSVLGGFISVSLGFASH